ncbi:MAG: putative DNA-binding domain-containing protein [Acidobacteriaceae bacterium]|nr:putative DNA-binding domain-containing protein [Acidobacteriaceae bacterium]MBV9779020.1 putative DNA-binding domain-containing protein [Acidobacteriaceae bacterium]
MNLAEIQTRMAADVMRPLRSGDRIASRTEHGQPMAEEAAAYVKPNDRLSSVERLEIYNRQYWFRVLDSLYEDFPGLCAVVGERRFAKLSQAYLRDCPSQSFTLRDLGSRLETWLREHPENAGERLPLALEMVQLEWAHIVAFDGQEQAPLGPEDLLELGPELRISLQPYITLLELHYPVDDLRIAVNARSEEHGKASNAVQKREHSSTRRKISRLKLQEIFLAVHRVDFSVYYRRLSAGEFHVLRALRDGQSIGEALDTAFRNSSLPEEEFQRMVEPWFSAWAELGWLCRA